MTDRELLELAARAAGINIVWYSAHPSIQEYPVLATKDKRPTSYGWNPLTDDGDALRLSVKLGLDINPYSKTQEVAAIQWDNATVNQKVFEKFGNDPYAATRRAIVRAAAEIGKGMK
jgi:hypothetical protein